MESRKLMFSETRSGIPEETLQLIVDRAIVFDHNDFFVDAGSSSPDDSCSMVHEQG